MKKPIHIKYKECVKIKALDGIFIREIFEKSKTNIDEVSLATGVVEPHHEASPHFHKRSDELYFIVSGKGRAIIDDKSYNVEKGDVVFIPVGSKHSLENNTDEKLEILAISAPAYTPEDFLK